VCVVSTKTPGFRFSVLLSVWNNSTLRLRGEPIIEASYLLSGFPFLISNLRVLGERYGSKQKK
jgi:hypothetical protein